MKAMIEAVHSPSGTTSDGRILSLVSGVGAADFERCNPPAGLWDRIAASIRADAEGRDDRSSGLGQVVEYCIDADDIVTTVGEGWTEFAEENNAPELAASVGSRTLWSCFGNDEIRDVWRLIVERVRADDIELQVPLRCDAPDTRRWFEVSVTPKEAGAVLFRSVCVYEESRAAVPLLDCAAERADDVAAVPLCSWCGHGHDGSRWLEIGQLVRESRMLESSSMPAIEYGICPDCREAMSVSMLVAAQSGDRPA